MKISKLHSGNECELCHKTGVFTAYMEDLNSNYFINVCINCYNKDKKK